VAITKLVWIALPKGLEDNGQTLRISAYLAPALAAASGTTVAQFPLFSSWPDTAAGIRFQLSFDNGNSFSAPVSASYDVNDALDTTLWTAIFGGNVSVGAHEPLTLDQDLQSYDANKVYGTLHGIYIPDPSELPPGKSEKLARLAALLRPSAAPATEEQLAYERFLEFHKHRPASGARLLAGQTDPPNSGALDFHAGVSALSRYPAAMRALGFVFDLALPIPSGLPAAGIVRVRPVSDAIPADWQIVFPNTAYSLDMANGFFTLRTSLSDPQHQLVSGMLFSGSAAVVPIELDALGLDANSAISGDVPDSAAKPTPRNAGFSFTLPDLDNRLQDQIASGNSVWAQIAANDDPNNHGDDLRTLFAEDLIRGYRVDVRVVETNQWRSLCRRRVTFDFGGTQKSWNEDEGLIGLGFTQQGDDAPRFYPMQLRWHGWGVCVPRPGKTVGVAGGADEQNQVTQALLPFRSIIEPAPSSLPRLRFASGHYQFRLRTVDLAGNSLVFDAPIDNAFAMPQASEGVQGEQYLRVDPLLAPVLLMRDPPSPGESVERLVIVSDFDAPPARACERLVAMPKAPVQMAEWHGMFDTPSGVNGDANTRNIVIKNSGSFPNAPYGNNPPTLPYLPDPLGAGAAFAFGDPPTFAPPQPYTNWPNYDPFRLLLVEAQTLQQPTWDDQTRTLTIGLPKAIVLPINISTYPANIDLLEPLNIVKRAPLRDPGGNQAPVKKFGSLDTPWTAEQKQRYQQLLASGQIPDISPPRTLTFVHATARPLVAPVLDMASNRLEGDTFTGFVGFGIPVDGNSTNKIELLAQWDEPVDDGANPPSRISKTQHVAVFQPLPGDKVWDLRFPLGPGGRPAITHEFGDTKYRKVTYQAVATTRFLEYLDPEIRDSPARITRVSNSLTLDVRASAPPPPPKLLYVVPTFRHASQNGSQVRTAGVRVYIDRPWFESGDGELLTVLLKAPPADNVVEQPETDSVWGTDPLYDSTKVPTPTPMFLTAANFRNKQFQQLVQIALPNGGVVQKIAVGFAVNFLPPDPSDPTRAADPNRDPHNGRWYCDLDIDAAHSYFPIMRLALARVQPNVFPEVSTAVIANIVPLTPNRAATVAPDPTAPGALRVTVAGPMSAIPPRIVVTPQIQPSPGLWISLAEVTLTPQLNTTESTQSGLVPVQTSPGSSPMRLLIREFETFPTDTGTGERLVYVELIRL
jgi:hypothetical protein